MNHACMNGVAPDHCADCVDQLALDFTAPLARATDPFTSRVAAAMAAPNANHGRHLALEALAKRPMTDFELAAETGWQQTSIGKRRLECQRAGWVAVAKFEEKAITRPAPSGRPALVWQITAAGRAALVE